MDLVLVLIYVDDIVVTRNNKDQVEETISKMNKAFALKDLGELYYLL